MLNGYADPEAIRILRLIVESNPTTREGDHALCRGLTSAKAYLRRYDAKDSLPERLIELAASHYGYTANRLTTRARTAHLALARQVAMTLCRRCTRETLTEIGRRFNRDHGTVVYANRVVENRVTTDARFAAEYGQLLAEAQRRAGSEVAV